MPELPEVESFRRVLESTSLHRTIEQVSLRAPEMLDGVGPRKLKTRLLGHEFTSARRHGKYVFAGTDGGDQLVLHFGMTGSLEFLRAGDESPRHVRLELDFAGGGRLVYDDMRKFGRFALADSVEAFVAGKGLGPDPLADGLDLDRFRGLFGRKKGAVKAAFLDQGFIAGIGNLYADEILFRAGIHPGTRTERLSGAELERLHGAMIDVLETAVRAVASGRELPAAFLARHRGPGGRCPKGGERLRRATVAGRTTWFCPRHQRPRRHPGRRRG